MTKHPDSTPRKPLRLWPGVALAIVLCLIWLIVPLVVVEGEILSMLGGVASGLAIVLWWLLFSRAPWRERIAAIVLMVAGVAVTRLVVHPSIATGHMGMTLPLYSIPVLGLALVAWAAAADRLSVKARRLSLPAAILVACALFTLIRTDGVRGEGASDFHWRWTPTAEDRLLAEAGPAALPSAPAPVQSAPAQPAAPSTEAPPAAPSSEKPAEKPVESAPSVPSATAPKPVANEPEVKEPAAEWPGFRGPGRDSVVRGVRIDTDWTEKPPREIWRRPIGPGWSSFAVQGDLVYTQEQRGEEEIVSCYRLSTGEPVWAHRDPIRFWESNAGAGPRATPAVHGGRVYSMGATGVVNALDARTGRRVWTRNAVTDTAKEIPGWGIAGSPLVVDDLVIVAVNGRLAAYDARTGKTRWLGPTGGGGYSSPHLVTIDGVPQILLLRGGRTISVSPADGKLLWEHTWLPGVGITQPALAGESDVLITVGDSMGGQGMRRVSLADKAGGWDVKERWTSRGLKPYFNDFVVHGGSAFGFDGSILACIDLQTGERKWKGGRYGHGQMLLLPDQDLLLVLSEEGELALVRATPDAHSELARFKAIEGKTWNHPTLVGDVLLVRNGEEMAAFRLAPAADTTSAAR